MDANAIWAKLSRCVGPDAVGAAQRMILAGEFTGDELAFIVAMAAMYPVALAQAKFGAKG